MGKRKLGYLLLTFAGVFSFACALKQNVFAAEPPVGKVLINEVESSDENSGNDWVELINTGTADADISGWYITDNKGAERLSGKKTHPLAAGTILKAGEVLVLENPVNFDFGLGKKDTVTLYDASGGRRIPFPGQHMPPEPIPEMKKEILPIKSRQKALQIQSRPQPCIPLPWLLTR